MRTLRPSGADRATRRCAFLRVTLCSLAASVAVASPARAQANDQRVATVAAGKYTPACYANLFNPNDQETGAPPANSFLYIPQVGRTLGSDDLRPLRMPWPDWRPRLEYKLEVPILPDQDLLVEGWGQRFTPDMLQCASGGRGCGVRLAFYTDNRYKRILKWDGLKRSWSLKTNGLRVFPGRSNWLDQAIIQPVPENLVGASQGDSAYYLKSDYRMAPAVTHYEMIGWLAATRRPDGRFDLDILGEWRSITYRSNTFQFADTTKGEIRWRRSAPAPASAGPTLSALGILAGRIPPFIPFVATAGGYPALEGGVSEGKPMPLMETRANMYGGRQILESCQRQGTVVVAGGQTCTNPLVPGDSVGTPWGVTTQPKLLDLTPSDTATGGLPPQVSTPMTTWSGAAVVSDTARVFATVVPDSSDRDLIGPDGDAYLAQLKKLGEATYCARANLPPDCGASLTEPAELAMFDSTVTNVFVAEGETRCTNEFPGRFPPCNINRLLLGVSDTLRWVNTELRTRDCKVNSTAWPDCATLLAPPSDDLAGPPPVIGSVITKVDSLDAPSANTGEPQRQRPQFTGGACLTGRLGPPPPSDWLAKLAEHAKAYQLAGSTAPETIGRPADSLDIRPKAPTSSLTPEQRSTLEAWWVRNCPGAPFPTEWPLVGFPSCPLPPPEE